jgi:isochorismate synthase
LSDFLAYRFPGHSNHLYLGNFKLCEDISMVKDSFLISDFLSEEKFEFNGTEISDLTNFSWHFSSIKPPEISKEIYEKSAEGMLKAIQLLGLKKVVFSRVKQVSFDAKNAVSFFNSLCVKYPKAFVYLVSSPLFGTWIGATPEVLLEVHGNHVFTMSLAGTKSAESTEEWNEKELLEQQYVTDFILDSLTEKGIDSLDQNGPYTYVAGPVKHLRTDISFDLKSLTPSEIAISLHPTPAVSGLPRALAIEMIEAVEKHDLNYNRSLYTGFLGSISREEAKLYVNLRCCQLFADIACLYLGGGLTKDSKVIDEWEETEKKSNTLLSVIQDVKSNNLK